jgi:hypothetical protein
MPLNLESTSHQAPLLTHNHSCKRSIEKSAPSVTMAVLNGNISRQKWMNFLMQGFEGILINIRDALRSG